MTCEPNHTHVRANGYVDNPLDFEAGLSSGCRDKLGGIARLLHKDPLSRHPRLAEKSTGHGLQKCKEVYLTECCGQGVGMASLFWLHLPSYISFSCWLTHVCSVVLEIRLAEQHTVTLHVKINTCTCPMAPGV